MNKKIKIILIILMLLTITLVLVGCNTYNPPNCTEKQSIKCWDDCVEKILQVNCLSNCKTALNCRSLNDY